MNKTGLVTALCIALGFSGMLPLFAERQAMPGSEPASRPATEPAKADPQAEVFTEWPFDANEALRRRGATAKALGLKEELVVDIGGDIGMKFILIPAGKFLMGSPKDEKDRSANESPQREVTISRGFYMGVYEVTQEQFGKIMGGNHSFYKRPTNPVGDISWNEAVEFCEKLSRKTGKKISLPTEARWEYACRAGSKGRFCYGDDDDYGELDDYAWYEKNSDGQPRPVGCKKANNFGLYDMHGNVWEWCKDWYSGKYPDKAESDPVGPRSGDGRVLRGGGWDYNHPLGCRSAKRIGSFHGSCASYGFRVVMELK